MSKKVLDYNGLQYFWSKLKLLLGGKQDTLVSGTNIKTINNQSILGSGNLNVSVPVTGDYIVERGTSGVWTYEKYNSGWYKAWYTGNINLLAGTAWAGGYYHNSSSTLAPPSFSKSVEYYTGSPNGLVLMSFVGVNTTNGTTAWKNGTAQATTNVPVHIECGGRWK